MNPDEYRRSSGWEFQKNSAIVALDARLAATVDQIKLHSTSAVQTDALAESATQVPGREYEVSSFAGRIPGLQEGVARALEAKSTRDDPIEVLRENVRRESTTRMPSTHAGVSCETLGEGEARGKVSTRVVAAPSGINIRLRITVKGWLYISPRMNHSSRESGSRNPVATVLPDMTSRALSWRRPFESTGPMHS